MDRFKEDFQRVKEIEDSISNNLKERAKLVKANQSTAKVNSLSFIIKYYYILPLGLFYKYLKICNGWIK